MQDSFAARMGRWSVQHRKKAILGWIAFVIASLAIGSAIGVKSPENEVSYVGDSGKAHELVDEHFPTQNTESIIVQAPKGAGAQDPAVRAALKQFQIDFAHQPSGAVLDGRDIGTVIAPDATVKLFVTASPEIRAERRYKQLIGKGIEATIQPILQDLRERDERDSQRSVAPLRQNADAELLDTSALTIDQAVARVMAWAQAKA